MADTDHPSALRTTPLHAAHLAAAGRMVAFAGYDMPVQYAAGVLKEHLWTRAHAGLFDVSHMGPAVLSLAARGGDGEADHRAVAALVEPLVCGDIAGLKPGQMRYTLLLNEAGGLVDDLMIGRPSSPGQQGSLYIVVNAGTKEGDFAAIAAQAGAAGRLNRADDGALIALQGPDAAAVLGALVPGAAELGFMTFATLPYQGVGLVVSRSGYTGEDGFEILCRPDEAEPLWNRLLADDRVAPVGLGARDSLRLEAGLPLYGHDVDAATSPIEAGLAFAVSRRRARLGDFPGAPRIVGELKAGPGRIRAGLRVLEGAPAREGAVVQDAAGAAIGVVTSGGYSPSLGASIAMAYLPPAFAVEATPVTVVVRGRAQPAEVVALPFVPHRYVRKPTP